MVCLKTHPPGNVPEWRENQVDTMVKNITKGAVIDCNPGQFSVHRVEKSHQPGREEAPGVSALVELIQGQDRQDQAQARYKVRRYAVSGANPGHPLGWHRPEPFRNQVCNALVRSGKETFFQRTSLLFGDRQKVWRVNFAQLFLVNRD